MMQTPWSTVASRKTEPKAAAAVKPAVDRKPVKAVVCESESALVKENRVLKARIEELEALCSFSSDPDVKGIELNMAAVVKKKNDRITELGNELTTVRKEHATKLAAMEVSWSEKIRTLTSNTKKRENESSKKEKEDALATMQETYSAALAAMEATHAAALAAMDADCSEKIGTLTHKHSVELNTIVIGNKAAWKKRESEFSSQIQQAQDVHNAEIQDLIAAKKSVKILSDTSKALNTNLKALKDKLKTLEDERKDTLAVLEYSNDAVALKVFMDRLGLPADSDPVQNLMICLKFTHTVTNGFNSHKHGKVPSAAEDRKTVELLYDLIDISAVVETAVAAINKQ